MIYYRHRREGGTHQCTDNHSASTERKIRDVYKKLFAEDI